MTTELITSKLCIPPLRTSRVQRPRLVQFLMAGLNEKRKLTLISAPAGFGKTTLVVDWLSQIDLPAAWLSLDKADNDLGRFLAYLAAAFQQVDEEIGALLGGALQSPQPLAVEKVMTGLLNEIAVRTNPLILVLDDYHLLVERAVLEVMDFLFHHLPAQLHLVIITREDPDLPLARVRARDQLTEVRARDLRFSQEEAGIFLRAVMGLALSEQDVARLEDRTEGWAAGLQLAGLSMQKQNDLKSFIAAFSGSQRHILDYLTDEVLQQQPEDVRTFLLQTAILDRLSGSLCIALTGRRDGDRILEHLEAANLFVIPLDEERRWYRYHHLFADLLRSQLVRTRPEWVPELHRRASGWYEENGDIRAAIEHALQDTDRSRAARLIEQHAFLRLYRGEVSTVAGWFDRLPEADCQSTPMLCIEKAWALALVGRSAHTHEVARTNEIALALSAAEQALDRAAADQALRDLVAGHAASIQAYLSQSFKQSGAEQEKLIALSQEAQRLLPEDERAIRSVNNMNIGFGYQVLADLEAASLAYQQTLEDGLAGGNYYAGIYGPMNLVYMAVLKGRLGEALRLCDTNIQRFNQIFAGQYFAPVGGLYIQKGSILIEMDRLAEAERALTEGLDLISWMAEFALHRNGYTALARLRAIQGNWSGMLETVRALEDILPNGFHLDQALRHRLAMALRPDDPGVRQDAQTWLDQSGHALAGLEVIQSLDSIHNIFFEHYLAMSHVLARLVKGKPGGDLEAYPLAGVQAYLERQMEFAETHGVVGWIVPISIARTLLYDAQGKQQEALSALQVGLCAAVPTGFFRIFVDECEPVQGLLRELKTQLTDETLIAYADRLLAAMKCEPVKPAKEVQRDALLSERELEILRHLARGLTYEETGRQLFLSLNTVQFHVKNIYSKLLVNKRLQAIEKARELDLI